MDKTVQSPNFEYLVNSSGQKIAELMPVPMEMVSDVEDLLIAKGCEATKFRREYRPKERD